MSWAAFIVSLVKAIPLLHELFMKCVDLYYQQMDAKDEANTQEIGMEREKVISELQKKDLTDEQRNQLRRNLYTISKR
jgi:hypothetical protein